MSKCHLVSLHVRMPAELNSRCWQGSVVPERHKATGSLQAASITPRHHAGGVKEIQDTNRKAPVIVRKGRSGKPPKEQKDRVVGYGVAI